MRLHIDPVRRSVPAARHWATAEARHAGLAPHLVEVVELLVSELVSNAVVHAAGPRITLDVHVETTRFTAAVSDTSDDLPVARTTGPEVPGGHGIRLVEQLSTEWGADVHPSGGKTVWFSVDRHHSHHAPMPLS